MKLALLFSCYTELDITKKRLKRLRRMNRGLPIYVLYGGRSAGAELFEETLSPFADDFYVFEGADSRPPSWKWQNQDAIITEWFLKRGGGLDWDTIAVLQWDCLAIEPLRKVFRDLKRDEVLFSGLKPIAEVESSWGWVSGLVPEYRAEYLRYKEMLRRKYGEIEPFLFSCIFIVACLPKSFLSRYASRPEPETGFHEYAMPTYAKLWKFRVRGDEPAFRTLYRDPEKFPVSEKERALSPFTKEISLRTVLLNWADPKAARIFHPYRGRRLCW